MEIFNSIKVRPFNVHTFSNTCTVYTDDNGSLNQHFKLCQEYLHMYTICLKKQSKSLKCIKWYLGCTLNTNVWISVDQMNRYQN